MIVNTASKCGNTPQYADLEKLYEKYKDKLGDRWFPCEQFWRAGTRQQYRDKRIL